MNERDAALMSIYESVKSRMAFDFGEFQRQLTAWDVVPLTQADQIIGGVLVKGNELHVGYKRRPTASILRHIKATLGRILADFGSATTVVDAGGGDPFAGIRDDLEKCTKCHGADGNSPTPAFPRLAGQHADYLQHALLAYTTGERKNAIMAGFAAALTAQDRADLAAWFASQGNGVYSIDATDLD